MRGCVRILQYFNLHSSSSLRAHQDYFCLEDRELNWNYIFLSQLAVCQDVGRFLTSPTVVSVFTKQFCLFQKFCIIPCATQGDVKPIESDGELGWDQRTESRKHITGLYVSAWVEQAGGLCSKINQFTDNIVQRYPCFWPSLALLNDVKQMVELFVPMEKGHLLHSLCCTCRMVLKIKFFLISSPCFSTLFDSASSISDSFWRETVFLLLIRRKSTSYAEINEYNWTKTHTNLLFLIKL